jgi:catechol 2,3-dioxygenase-like lactoylglutathione lyase family enzyme
MSTTDTTTEHVTELPSSDVSDMRVEVVVVPVSDVDRSRQFYEQLGWRFDTELESDDGVRLVQFTPPGSLCSVSFGEGITSAQPGSVDGLVLAVHDVQASRAALVARGIDVSDVFHDAGGIFHHAGTNGRVPGPHPERRTYASWASFSDPDGNSFLLQEITSRVPGR